MKHKNWFALITAIICLATLISTTKFAYSAVEEVDLGACWFEDRGETVRIASTQRGLAREWNKNDLAAKVRAGLEQQANISLAQTAGEIDFRCSSAAVHFWARAQANEKNLCASVQLDGKITQVFANSNPTVKGTCRPHAPGRIFAYISDAPTRVQLVQALLQPNAGSVVERIEIVANIVYVHVDEKYWYRETAAINDLNSIAAIAKIQPGFALDSTLEIVGETRPIWRGLYPGKVQAPQNP